MIQVIERAFSILAKLADDPLRVWTISEMAEIIDVQPATCFHIVNSMVDLGYIERLGMRKGYRLGPAVNRLCHSSAYRPDLVEAADTLLRAFADKYKEPILIAVLQGVKRYVICQADPEAKLQVNYNLTIIEDTYNTATGRLLLAGKSDEIINEFVDKAGLPSRGAWGEVDSRERLFEELRKIRERKAVILESDTYLAQIGFPIIDADGNTTAAIGSFVPKYRFEGAHKDEIIAGVLNAAQAISRKLAEKKKE